MFAGLLSLIVFFPPLPADESHGTHLVTMRRKSHLLESDLVSFSVGLGDVCVVCAAISVMRQGMGRRERLLFSGSCVFSPAGTS